MPHALKLLPPISVNVALPGAPDVQGSQIGAAESSDPLYVHSLLFVVLEQFDALRKQALVNLGVGVAAVALSGAAAVELSFASTRNSSPRSRHAAAATATVTAAQAATPAVAMAAKVAATHKS